MSATGRGAPRIELDFYETPAWAVRAVLPMLPTAGDIVEPGCGRGAIIRELYGVSAPARPRTVRGIEIFPARAAQARRVAGLNHNCEILEGDFLRAYPDLGADLVIGNPPFELAMPFVRRSLEVTKRRGGTVALLLRLAWLSSAERAPFHRAHPADVYVLDARPSFAASLKCAPGYQGKKKQGQRLQRLPSCGWAVVQPLDAPRPPSCPECGARVSVTTNDSSDYAWFCWGPGRGGRWSLLDTAQLRAEERKCTR